MPMPEKLALDGGTPVRTTTLPYARQWVDEDDITAVVEVLRSDWLTTGPLVSEFEAAFAEQVGAREAVAVSSGTAALHAAMFGLGLETGDEVIVPSMSFAASANCIVYQGGVPVFADVEPDTLLIDPEQVQAKITSRTKAIIAVDYAGQACRYDELRALAERYGLSLVADACHALGGSYRGSLVGTIADLNTFSFHPAKHITTGEGGVVTTDDTQMASRMRAFRNHGISSDRPQRDEQGSWFYEMNDLGYNYRLTDFQSALGIRQLPRLQDWVRRRQEIASAYDAAFTESPLVHPLCRREEVYHAYHLYVVQVNLERSGTTRSFIFAALRAEGIGVNVHYVPIHLHPFYRTHFATQPGMCPVTEDAYERIISLPIFPRMSDDDFRDVVRSVEKVALHLAA